MDPLLVVIFIGISGLSFIVIIFIYTVSLNETEQFLIYDKETDKYYLDVDIVRATRSKIKSINAIPLEKIVFLKNKKPLKINEQALKDWKFTGLSNFHFIENL